MAVNAMISSTNTNNMTSVASSSGGGWLDDLLNQLTVGDEKSTPTTSSPAADVVSSSAASKAEDQLSNTKLSNLIDTASTIVAISADQEKDAIEVSVQSRTNSCSSTLTAATTTISRELPVSVASNEQEECSVEKQCRDVSSTSNRRKCAVMTKKEDLCVVVDARTSIDDFRIPSSSSSTDPFSTSGARPKVRSQEKNKSERRRSLEHQQQVVNKKSKISTDEEEVKQCKSPAVLPKKTTNVGGGVVNFGENPLFRRRKEKVDDKPFRLFWWSVRRRPSSETKTKEEGGANDDPDGSTIQLNVKDEEEEAEIQHSISAVDEFFSHVHSESSSSESKNLAEDSWCETCGCVCLTSHMSPDKKCPQCFISVMVNDELEQPSAKTFDEGVACTFCKSFKSFKEIDRHEERCSKNPSVSGVKMESVVRRRRNTLYCKHCRSPISEDYVQEHERDCNQNPVIKEAREAANQAGMREIYEEFRRAPNPEPAAWPEIQSRQSRSTERRSERYGFVSGIGMDELEIPCEFCSNSVFAKRLYDHERNCALNPLNDRGSNSATGVSARR